MAQTYVPLKNALEAYEPHDAEGIFVVVSRQACDEAVKAIDALEEKQAMLVRALKYAAAPDMYDALLLALTVIEVPAPEMQATALRDGFAALSKARGGV